MSNLTENKPLLNRIVLGKKTKIFLRVLLWMEILVIGLYVLNIIFSYFITDAFDIQNIFTFHIEVWTILLKTDDLIKELDKIFPNQFADLKDSEREIFFKSGQRSVVEFLKSKQTDNILKRK